MDIKKLYLRVKKCLIAGLVITQMCSCTLHYNATINSRNPHYSVYGRVSGTYTTKEEKRKLKKEPPYVDLSGWSIK